MNTVVSVFHDRPICQIGLLCVSLLNPPWISRLIAYLCRSHHAELGQKLDMSLHTIGHRHI